MTRITPWLLCLAITWAAALPLYADEPAQPISETQLAELQAKVKQIADRYSDWQAETPLKALLENLPTDVQIQAMLPAIQIGPTEHSAGQPAICKRLGEFGDASTKPLLKLLDDADAQRRAAACHAIEQMQFKNQSKHPLPWANEVGPKLAELLTKDASPAVRREAASALGSLGEQASPWAEAMVSAVHDADKDVRRTAIGELEHIGPSTTFDSISSDDPGHHKRERLG